MSLSVTSNTAAVTEHPGVTADQSALSRALLVVVGAEIVLLYAATFRWLLDRWTMSVWHNAHGFLIPPVVAYFAWRELRPLRGQPRDASAWGFVFLLAAMGMHVLDAGIHTQILSAVSIVVALPGLALLFLGPARTKAIAFPLAFSVFMLPIPLVMTERIHLVGRQIATTLSAYVLPFLGISVYSEGTSLQLGNGTLFVGDGCSGFSTVYAAVAVAALTAYSCNHWRGRALALTAAVPLALASNALRVVVLAVLVQWRGFGVLETWLHPASGVLTFVLSLPVIFWLGTPRPEGTRS